MQDTLLTLLLCLIDCCRLRGEVSDHTFRQVPLEGIDPQSTLKTLVHCPCHSLRALPLSVPHPSICITTRRLLITSNTPLLQVGPRYLVRLTVTAIYPIQDIHVKAFVYHCNPPPLPELPFPRKANGQLNNTSTCPTKHRKTCTVPLGALYTSSPKLVALKLFSLCSRVFPKSHWPDPSRSPRLMGEFC